MMKLPTPVTPSLTGDKAGTFSYTHQSQHRVLVVGCWLLTQSHQANKAHPGISRIPKPNPDTLFVRPRDKSICPTHYRVKSV